MTGKAQAKFDLRPQAIAYVRMNPQRSRAEIANDMLISEASLGRILRGEGVGPVTARRARLFLAKQLNLPGWPDRFVEMKRQYQFFDDNADYDSFERFIAFTIPMLEELSERNHAEDAESCCTHWLLSHCFHDRAQRVTRRSNEERQKDRDTALTHYQTAKAIADKLVAAAEKKEGDAARAVGGADSEAAHEVAVYRHMSKKLRVAYFGTYINTLPKGQRQAAIARFSKDHSIVQVVHDLSEAEPDDWSLIRNGLIAASSESDKDNCFMLFEKLISADEKFRDLNFKPSFGTVPSINEDSDLGFARQVLQNYAPAPSGKQ